MLTYYKLLQIHAKTPSIILPTETFTFWPNSSSLLCSSSSEATFGVRLALDKITENNDNYVFFQVYFIISGLYSFQKNGGTKANNCGTAFQGRIRRNFDENNNVQTKQTKMEQWVHHKYNMAFVAVIMNSFLTDDLKEEIFGIIEKTQRSYFALKRFLHICLFKNTKIKIDTDLCLNPIDPLKAFTIVQNGGKYLFTVPDILNLTMAALMNAQDFFAEPRFPKNPYTNVKFTKTDMYNIYFRVVESRFITPPLFTECFLCHFELDNFLIDNETKLRNLSIKNYVMNSPHTILYSEVMFMIRIYFKGKQVTHHRTRIPRTRCNGTRIISSTTRISIDIHPEFPREVLVDIMRPYLYLYLLFHDHIRGTEKRTISKTLLQREIQRFLKYNPKFGRKQINTSYQNHGNPFDLDSQNRVLTSSFNDRHEIFTIQTADEMFNTKFLLQKNNEINVIGPNLTPEVASLLRSEEEFESESSNYDDDDGDDDGDDGGDDDDDSITEVYGLYDYGFTASAAPISRSVPNLTPEVDSLLLLRNSEEEFDVLRSEPPFGGLQLELRRSSETSNNEGQSPELFEEDFRNNYSENNYIGLAILFTGTYDL